MKPIPRDSQRLAAIMFTDIVGFSAMMARDESGTLSLIGQQRDLLLPLLETHGGTLHKEIGDGTLCSFASASQAVDCAVALQKAIIALEKFRVRIGLHIGEVTEQGGDILGDGVNIAARIEPLAAPGGIAVSESIVAALRAEPAYRFVSLGRPVLKNIGNKLEIFAVESAGLSVKPPRRRITRWQKLTAGALVSAVLFAGLFVATDIGRQSWRGTAKAEDQPSVAVLPFSELSSNADGDYFSDGIAEEVLNLLARLPNLRVISRSSAFAFKGKDVPIPEIARRLNVEHIVEGTVRRNAGKVRVTAKLVAAKSDSYLWTATYERDAGNIFEIQQDVANRVVSELRVRFAAALPKPQATSPESYGLYLQGLQLARQFSHDTLPRAAELFRAAGKIDPNYVPAKLGLATVLINSASLFPARRSEFFREADGTIQSALSLAPDSGMAYSRLGWLAMRRDSDLAAAAKHMEHALALDPTNVSILGGAASLLSTLGRSEEALPLADYVAARDPVSPTVHFNLAGLNMRAGRVDQAIRSYEAALALSPNMSSGHYALGLALLHAGQFDRALAEFEREPNPEGKLHGGAMALFSLGKEQEFRQRLDAFIKDWGAGNPLMVAEIYAWASDPEKAFHWLDTALKHKDARLGNYESVFSLMLLRLKSDRRWKEFEARLDPGLVNRPSIPFSPRPPAQTA